MSNFDITTDAVEVYAAFEEFTLSEMRKALKAAVKETSKQLQKLTKQNLKKSVHNTNRQNPKFNDTLEKGVRTTKVWEADGTFNAKVRIDSSRNSGSGSYRLHILEKGTFKTPNRYAYTKGKHTHKPSYRGSLRAYNFFENAKNEYLPKYEKAINDAVAKAVDRINKKKMNK